MDLERYADRIGWNGAPRPTEDTLRELVFAHARAIPFENLDVLRGVPIRLEPEAIVAKLVAKRRGGYCFEQNGLLLAALRTVGFDVRPLAARVLLGGGPPRPRTHMLLLVTIAGRQLLADVGFGTYPLLGPIPFEDGRHVVHGETFRISGTTLEVLEEDGFVPLYRFSLEEQEPIDFVAASWFTSTHPESLFVKKRIVSRVDVGKRWILVDHELRIHEGRFVQRKRIKKVDVTAVLRDTFRIVI